ncbi:polysaccharide deacetylase family protein [Lysinibacillus sp. NPDC093712]|uniref:polysaccharide deacetylase family protein n=1 Tax=Lysinibacillus sp. NPDC093712 TaxID=3390579 RepID=UPI003D02F6DC
MIEERRKRRRPIIDLLLIGLIVTLISIILVIILSKDEFKFQKISASKDTNSESNLSTENSAFPGIRIVSDVSNDKRSPFAVHYPQTENKVFNETVLQFITDAKDNYLSSMKNNKNKEAKGELTINLETFPFHEHHYSFVLTKMQYLGGANHVVSTTTFFYNNETGEQINIQTLLQNDNNNLSTLAAYVRKDLQQNLQLKEVLNEDELLKVTEPKWENFNRFAIVDDSIHFYFDEYEIASGSAGAPIVKLSLSLINPLLASEFQIAMETMEPTKPPVSPGDPNVKRIALTFDDGPHPKVTEQILNTLDKYHAKATFFMLGSRVKHYPDIARDVLARGHEIGNHTWNHPVLTKMPLEQVLKEYTSTANEIELAINQGATVFRPPYGATNDEINEKIPVPVVLWSIDTLDWKHRNSQLLLTYIKSNLHNNSIVLMHDIHQSTADGLDAVLAYLQGEGYEFVTVSEILPYRQ